MSGKRGREEEEEGKSKKVTGAGHWSRGLLFSMTDPQLIVKEDEKVVAIKDKYPKAKHHYLVLPKENIPSLAKVSREHLPLLKHMQQVGKELADRNPESGFRWKNRSVFTETGIQIEPSYKVPSPQNCQALKILQDMQVRNFKRIIGMVILGYHAQASMERLHLHIISDDFISPCLKTKKHWNTFTTGFFVPSEDIIKQVEEKGKVVPVSAEKIKEYMNMSLRCHKCNMQMKNIPTLKKHLETVHATKV